MTKVMNWDNVLPVQTHRSYAKETLIYKRRLLSKDLFNFGNPERKGHFRTGKYLHLVQENKDQGYFISVYDNLNI